MIIAIDLMSIVYCTCAIPTIIALSKIGWSFGKYLEAMWDLKWRKAKKELNDD
jgi:hypothetical protein